MYRVNQEKWSQFSRDTQLKNVAAELLRATKASLGVKENEAQKNGAYERALSLIDASIDDPKWQNKELLYQLRDAVAALYVGKADPAISRFIYTKLLSQ